MFTPSTTRRRGTRGLADYYGNPVQAFPFGLNSPKTDNGTSPAQKWPFGLNNRRSLGCAGCPGAATGGCGSCAGGQQRVVLARGLGRWLGQSDPYFDPATGADVFNPTTLQPVATDVTVYANPATQNYQTTPAVNASAVNFGGLPLTYILGGGAAFVVLMALMAKKR